jgi:hypothetical protein
MVLLPNVTITTARSSFSTGSGVTGAPTAYLSNIDAHILPVTQQNYKMLPFGALESDFIVKVDPGIDIKEADIVTSILLPDRVTPWPGMGLSANSNEFIRVVYAQESTPYPIPERRVYIKRERGGGPVY